jgi:hypothetical protein
MMVDERIEPDLEWERPQILPLEQMRASRPERVGIRALIIIGICLMFFSSLTSSVGVLLIRQTQVENRPVALNTNQLVKYVRDCTTVGGECYEKNQRRLAQTLGSVDVQNRRVSSAAAACSLGVPQDLSQHRRYLIIKRCVDRTIKAEP